VSGYQGDGRLCGAVVSRERQGLPGGEEVTRAVLVFSQGEDRIVNAQLWVKLKLPARRQEKLIGQVGSWTWVPSSTKVLNRHLCSFLKQALHLSRHLGS
jgi:hypothetical protein